jgi:hypothetical protein
MAQGEDFIEALQQRLAFVDLLYEIATLPEGVRPILIARRGHIKLQIYADAATHRRPHFHIRYKDEFSASYAIDDFSPLAGKMPARYEKPILEWAKANQTYLSKAWQQVNSGSSPAAIDIERIGG